MIEGPTDESSLKGLADAIKLLYGTEAREWTADDVISLVDELSGVFLPFSLIPGDPHILQTQLGAVKSLSVAVVELRKIQTRCPFHIQAVDAEIFSTWIIQETLEFAPNSPERFHQLHWEFCLRFFF